MATCLIGLGSNEGDRAATLDAALARLDSALDVAVRARSDYVSTAPVGGPAGQGEYLNAVAVVETNRTPQALAEVLWEIERNLGRRRPKRWAPRPIDLDLLLYDSLMIETPSLIVPHPRMAFRRFVLVPACQVAADMVHPVVGWTLGRLLAHLDSAPDYVALAGLPGSGKTRLVKRLAEAGQAEALFDPLSAEDLAAWRTEPQIRSLAFHDMLLQRRTAALRHALSLPSRGQTLVSDFWLDQTLVYARLWIDGSEWDEFHGIWRAASCAELRPKLLVLLDRPVDQLPPIVDEPPAHGSLSSRESLEVWRQGLLAQTGLPGQGPVLHLDASDLEQCVAETAAAIDSIR